jgi:hypothetical protein
MTAQAHPLLSVREEIERLMSADSGEHPSIWLGPLELRVRCEGDAALVLSRAREIMRAVLTHLSEEHSDEEWRSLLPPWFTAQCSDEVLPDDDRWSLSGWLEWFTGGEERGWRWWDSAVVDKSVLRVRVISDGLPFAWGALDWMLRCSGGTEVDPMF